MKLGSNKNWTGLTEFNGQYIWSDGANIYYSYDSSNYVLDKSTGNWYPKTWNGCTIILGEHVWFDGINKYYSDNTYSNKQYVLEKVSTHDYPINS